MLLCLCSAQPECNDKPQEAPILLSPKKERVSPKPQKPISKRVNVEKPSPKLQAVADGGDESDEDREEHVPKLVRKGIAQRRPRVVVDSSDSE